VPNGKLPASLFFVASVVAATGMKIAKAFSVDVAKQVGEIPAEHEDPEWIDPEHWVGNLNSWIHGWSPEGLDFKLETANPTKILWHNVIILIWFTCVLHSLHRLADLGSKHIWSKAMGRNRCWLARAAESVMKDVITLFSALSAG
jgi:hypothetical protein